MPAWVIQDGPERGAPISYHHYHYGLHYLRRQQAREQLAMANAVRMAKTQPDEFRSWTSEMRMAAGFE